jgi:hypothetical protein
VRGWTNIPRWLYESDLSDEELQELYVKGVHKKLAELLEERRELDEQIAQARALLADAGAALARYRAAPAGRRRRGP